MDTKAAFEAEFRKQNHESNSLDILLEWYNHGTEKNPDFGYYSLAARQAFKWWCLSRAAIEIELPGGTGWASDQYNHGRNDGINQCAESVKFHGIRIKGKTE